MQLYSNINTIYHILLITQTQNNKNRTVINVSCRGVGLQRFHNLLKILNNRMLTETVSLLVACVSLPNLKHRQSSKSAESICSKYWIQKIVCSISGLGNTSHWIL